MVRQFVALARLSMRRAWRSPAVYTIFGLSAPLATFGFLLCSAELTNAARILPPERLLRVFNGVFMGAYLHFGLILGGAVYAASVFREELDRQTLHHLFLQPIPRWLVPGAKLLGFMGMALPIFLGNLLLILLMVTLPRVIAGSWDLFTLRHGMEYLAYALVATLALLVYGSIFSLLSSFLKGSVQVLIVVGWEASSHLLPDLLKNFTMTYYLGNMLPWNTKESAGAVALLTEGPGPIQTTLVLGFVVAFSMAASSMLATRRQCLYGTT